MVSTSGFDPENPSSSLGRTSLFASHPALPPLPQKNILFGVFSQGKKKAKREKKVMAVPGFEPGSSGSQPLMLTTTLYHLITTHQKFILTFVSVPFCLVREPKPFSTRPNSFCHEIEYCVAGVMVSIVAFQAVDPGSIPGPRIYFFHWGSPLSSLLSLVVEHSLCKRKVGGSIPPVG